MSWALYKQALGACWACWLCWSWSVWDGEFMLCPTGKQRTFCALHTWETGRHTLAHGHRPHIVAVPAAAGSRMDSLWSLGEEVMCQAEAGRLSCIPGFLCVCGWRGRDLGWGWGFGPLVSRTSALSFKVWPLWSVLPWEWKEEEEETWFFHF